jgi:type IV secretion system protein VirB1
VWLEEKATRRGSVDIVIVWHGSWRNAMPIDVCVLTHCNVNNVARTRCHRIAQCGLGVVTRNDSVTRRKGPSSNKPENAPPTHRFIITLLALLALAIPAATQAAPLAQSEFALLAARCASAVPAATLKAVAWTESGFDPWALHDNTTDRTENASSLELAVTDATRWIGQHHSVDVGLMQINAANFHALGMTMSDALDPCMSLAGGAAVLRAAYGGGVTPAEQQAALLMALSRYNTGSPFQGIMNGYARTVLENAGRGQEALPILPAPASLLTDPNAPPPWNVSAAGTYAQQHGASWIIDLAPSPGAPGAPSTKPTSAAIPEQFAASTNASFSMPSTTR